MKVVLTTVRMGLDGSNFKTIQHFEHAPVSLDPQIGGWSGENAGLSNFDLERVVQALLGSARNIQSFTVEFVDEVEELTHGKEG